MILKAHPLFENDVKKLDKRDKERLLDALEKIKEDPTRYKPVKGIPSGFRARIGNLRVVYMVKGSEMGALPDSYNGEYFL